MSPRAHSGHWSLPRASRGRTRRRYLVLFDLAFHSLGVRGCGRLVPLRGSAAHGLQPLHHGAGLLLSLLQSGELGAQLAYFVLKQEAKIFIAMAYGSHILFNGC